MLVYLKTGTEQPFETLRFFKKKITCIKLKKKNQNDEGKYDDQGRDGGTNFILRIKEQESGLTLH